MMSLLMMLNWSSCRFVVSVIVMCSLYTIACPALIKFETQLEAQIKEEFVNLEVSSSSIIRCAALCLWSPRCVSTSYNNDGSCRMSENEINGTENQNKLNTEPSWISLSKGAFCPGGWIEIQQTCHFFLQEMKNYSDVKGYCEREGGKLAEPLTNVTYEALRTYMMENLQNSDFSYYWFGLTDEDEENWFIWNSNGKETSYIAWRTSDEPNGGNNYNCVLLMEAMDFRWSDAPCRNINYAVCELE